MKTVLLQRCVDADKSFITQVYFIDHISGEARLAGRSGSCVLPRLADLQGEAFCKRWIPEFNRLWINDWSSPDRMGSRISRSEK